MAASSKCHDAWGGMIVVSAENERLGARPTECDSQAVPLSLLDDAELTRVSWQVLPNFLLQQHRHLDYGKLTLK